MTAGRPLMAPTPSVQCESGSCSAAVDGPTLLSLTLGSRAWEGTRMPQKEKCPRGSSLMLHGSRAGAMSTYMPAPGTVCWTCTADMLIPDTADGWMHGRCELVLLPPSSMLALEDAA